ncbi:MAG: flagellar basal body P-ring formation chaperone FlgA [Planctomycetota bacterium]
MRKVKFMKIKNLRLAFVLIASTIGFAFLMQSQASAEQLNPGILLKIHLPREVSVQNEHISLADIGILGGDEYITLKAGDVVLGKFSVPGQEIVIERATILSRLASNGYPESRISFTGSLKVIVKRKQNILKSKMFVESGRRFLKENLPYNSICKVDPVIVPKDLILAEGQSNFQLISRLAESGNRSQSKVRVGVFVEGKQIATRDVTFRFKFNSRKAVALFDIPAGAVITSENIRIEKAVSNYPEPADWSPPYGLVARRRIPANSTVENTAVGATENIVVIERNQTVTIRAESPGLVITAVGIALQKGQAGEFIRVRNVDSKRIVFAKVCEDGTVKPVF